MSDDNDDASKELRKTGEKMGGIADRFGTTTEATDTTDTTETVETPDTNDTFGPGDEGVVLREDWPRAIYLPDDVVDAADVLVSTAALAGRSCETSSCSGPQQTR